MWLGRIKASLSTVLITFYKWRICTVLFKHHNNRIIVSISHKGKLLKDIEVEISVVGMVYKHLPEPVLNA